MTDQPLTEPQDGSTPDAPASETESVPEPDTFPLEVVRRLRAEAAEARVRAKVGDIANEHLLAAYAQVDGRLVDPEVLALSPDLLGDDGVVDPGKVTERITTLLTDKPYLHVRKPAAVPQGVRSDPPATVGWVDLLRGSR